MHVDPETYCPTGQEVGPAGGPQTVFAVVVQADVTTLFAPEHVVHAAQGAVPALDHVEPATQDAGADAHTVSAVAIQAVVTEPEHAVHAAQGAVPALDHVEPATQDAGADAHTVSAVAIQAVVTEPEHAVHAAQGTVPALDHVEPATQDAGADAHTVSVVAVQAVVTEPEHAVHAVQGEDPVLDQFVPATHALAAQTPVVGRQAQFPPEQDIDCPVGQLPYAGGLPEQREQALTNPPGEYVPLGQGMQYVDGKLKAPFTVKE